MSRPTTAMVLAAGLGKRMRPITDAVPKPLVRLGGKPLIDHVLDRLATAGVTKAVVNVHYRADQMERHLAGRSSPRIVISDERDQLLETGGGVVRALPLIGDEPFIIHNSDTVWIEGPVANLDAMIAAWDEARMDSLLLLATSAHALGYDGAGDFTMSADGLIARRREGQVTPFVFAGVSIAHPRLFDGVEAKPFSLNRLWDRAMAQKRLFGIRLDGYWMHVGTPEALDEADACYKRGGPET